MVTLRNGKVTKRLVYRYKDSKSSTTALRFAPMKILSTTIFSMYPIFFQRRVPVHGGDGYKRQVRPSSKKHSHPLGPATHQARLFPELGYFTVVFDFV